MLNEVPLLSDVICSENSSNSNKKLLYIILSDGRVEENLVEVTKFHQQGHWSENLGREKAIVFAEERDCQPSNKGSWSSSDAMEAVEAVGRAGAGRSQRANWSQSVREKVDRATLWSRECFARSYADK